MASDFLNKVLKPDKKKQLGTMSNIDISSLIQYIGVLQVNCKDPSKYCGYNLVQEAASQLDEVTNTAPIYETLVMTICNADGECILSFNMLALACLVNKVTGAPEDAKTNLPSVKSLRGLIVRFTKYLDSDQEKDGGFGKGEERI
jgi:hypothetical protein